MKLQSDEVSEAYRSIFSRALPIFVEDHKPEHEICVTENYIDGYKT
jgi:hypothetical protein